MSKKDIVKTIDYQWRELKNRGISPSIRYNTASCVYKGDLWMILGAGAGIGRTSEVCKFDMNTHQWETLTCTGDIPGCRDGHSATYIGRGRFLVFGGQGVPYENDSKSEKITDQLKVKTYFVREVYNTLHMLDCETLVWTALPIEGAAMPMGRRGHSANYIPTFHVAPAATRDVAEHGPGHAHPGKAHVVRDIDTTPAAHEHILLIFGGSGVEPSKYTETIFNDLWAFSMDGGRWMKMPTRGIEPRPMFDHRTELIGDHTLLVTGGITSVSSFTKRAPVAEGVTDMMLLNTKTWTWSYLDTCDHSGRPMRLNLHGHTLVSDWTDGSNAGGLVFIFGGKEAVDLEHASSGAVLLPTDGKKRNAARRRASVHQHMVTHAWRLDIFNRGMLTPLLTTGVPPENRYGHVGVSCMDMQELFHEHNAVAAGALRAHSAHGKSSHHHHWSGHVKNKISFDPHEEPLMLIYGGSRVDQHGFCDPIVYQLLRVHSYTEVGVNVGSADGAEEVDRPAGFVAPGSPITPGALNMLDTGGVTRRDGHNVVGRRLSIWEKKILHNSQNDSNLKIKIKNPESWTELKVALSFPLHEKRTAQAEQAYQQQQQQQQGQRRFPGSPTSAQPFGPSPHGSVLGSPNAYSRLQNAGRNSLEAALGNASSSVPGSMNGGALIGGLSHPANQLPSLESSDERKARIRALSASLLPIVKGLTVHDAKQEYLRRHPPSVSLDDEVFFISAPHTVSRKFPSTIAQSFR